LYSYQSGVAVFIVKCCHTHLSAVKADSLQPLIYATNWSHSWTATKVFKDMGINNWFAKISNKKQKSKQWNYILSCIYNMISCKTISFIYVCAVRTYVCSKCGHYHPIICALQDQNIDINHDPAPFPFPISVPSTPFPTIELAICSFQEKQYREFSAMTD